MSSSRVVVATGGLLAVAASLWLLSPPVSLLAAALAVTCAIVVAVDLERYIIPDTATIAIAALGLTDAWIGAPPEWRLTALTECLARGLAAGAVLYLTAWTYRRVTGRDGLGLGDVKLGAAAGAGLGWTTLPMALELAVFLAILALAATALVTRRLPDRHAAIPFGVFLAPAIWLGFLLEKSLISP